MFKALQTLLEPSARAIQARANDIEPKLQKWPDSRLAETIDKLKTRVNDGQALSGIMPEAFACVREAARRSIGLRHFDVQIQGGVSLARGKIVEMATGEGKTLVATLPATLHALAGKGVHVVTVNDYLAARDAKWMEPVYRMLGLTVGCIQESMNDPERQAAYNRDITYGTNHEMVFDSLRDNLVFEKEKIVHRDFHFAIVDEVDLLLIDEAQTPLIISGQGESDKGLFSRVDVAIRRLKEGEDYISDQRTRTAALTDTGLAKIESFLGVGSLSHPDNLRWMHASHKSLQAHGVYRRDVDYIIDAGRVLIVDEHTGRVSEDKRFSDGLHQALEAKERVEVLSEDSTLAKTSYQHYFRGYRGLCGMTGTARSEREEFRKIYGRKVVSLATHKPMIRKDYEKIIYPNMSAKHRAVIDEIVAMHESGQPVLVGTVSVRESETISRLLKKRSIRHKVLNAKHHANEADIIAQAGRLSAVTISTNMAGRGTDIILGGNARKLAENKADPNTSQWENILRDFEAQCAKEKRQVLEQGGLCVIGTGEHESPRIDDQLRGRAGRQGDPGSSLFFISPEDTVYQRFGRRRGLDEVTRRLKGHPPEKEVEDTRIKTILTELRKMVEIENQAIRLDVFKYDSVIHERREAIRLWRLQLLDSDSDTKWRKSAGQLLGELLDEIGQRFDEEDDDAEIGKWKASLMLMTGRGELFKDDAVPNREAAFDWIMSRYSARIGLGFDSRLAIWERSTLLSIIDTLWTQYLTDLERVEEGIGLRAYANLDPNLEFRREAGRMFSQLMFDIRLHVAQAWLSVDPNQLADSARLQRSSALEKKNGSKKRVRAIDRLPRLKRSKRKKRKS